MSNVTIRPLRFTADVEGMRAFLETLGLRSRIESEHGGWVDMLTGRGMVALHDAASSSTGGQPGQTNLSFEADKIDELRDRLEQAGFVDATVFDEAYGRVLSVTGPDGVVIWVDERAEDMYGYKVHDARPDERWSVTPYLSGAEEQAWRRFFEGVGMDTPVRVGPSGSGFAVRLDLSTTEDLDEVNGRLDDYEVKRTASGLEIVDPDGQLVVVHG
ncbi:VOC family protein [Kribbella jiaozuonensis]|uniref:VOC family protein n=1 Tax=Kribbella jiaozuonensis TaxID=2575441 RepID=A0A4U3LUD6_9ACTN|nr:VOC family protein [Kribbella jiaozuonensis]TKK79695.1 VOC family protein [Kribbella jiaozuonensis]